MAITQFNRESWRRVERMVEASDIVMEVLDARDPEATRSPRAEAMVRERGKGLLIVLNKADLVPMNALLRWKRALERDAPTIFISAKYRLGTRMLTKTIKRTATRIPVTVLVMGYPNVGKSTIINYLSGRYAAPTSPVPGWTRGEKIIKARPWLTVIDSPGIIPMESNDPGMRIVRGEESPSDVEDPVRSAISLIKRMLELGSTALMDRYGIDVRDPMEAIEAVARRRGFLLRGGRLNIDEAARAILRDWIEGKLTYYTLPRGDST
jgi:ribosome biogenesis GTPase A